MQSHQSQYQIAIHVDDDDVVFIITNFIACFLSTARHYQRLFRNTIVDSLLTAKVIIIIWFDLSYWFNWIQGNYNVLLIHLRRKQHNKKKMIRRKNTFIWWCLVKIQKAASQAQKKLDEFILDWLIRDWLIFATLSLFRVLLIKITNLQFPLISTSVVTISINHCRPLANCKFSHDRCVESF